MQHNNQLYSIFLKLDQLQLTIIGAGEVAAEKLHFILKSSPNAVITLIAPEILPPSQEIYDQFRDNITYIKKSFEPKDILSADIVVAATNIPAVNQTVYHAAKAARKIVNIADTPHLCDFYMGGIVSKGSMKIEISANGAAPTVTKRLRQYLETILPDETEELLSNLRALRSEMGDDFERKVRELNEITSTLLAS